MAGSDENYDALRRMDQEFERSKAALMVRFLRDQEELNTRLKNIGLVGGNAGDNNNSNEEIAEGSAVRWNPAINKRREGASRPQTAAGYRSRRCHKLNSFSDFSAIINDNDKISRRDTDIFGDDIEPVTQYQPTTNMAPKVTRAGRRLRPKTSCGFRDNTTNLSEIGDNSDRESDVSNASITSIADNHDTCLDIYDIGESFEGGVDTEHRQRNDVKLRDKYRPAGQSYHSQLVHQQRGNVVHDQGMQYHGDMSRPRTSSSMYGAMVMGAGVTCHDQLGISVQPRPSSFHKRKVKNIDAAAAATICPETDKPLISIDNKQTAAAKLGLSNATRIECDANLYKKLRNKSAPGLRHTDGHVARKPISVYHLPPLDTTVVSERGSRSTTPATSATFHSPASYIEANLLK